MRGEAYIDVVQLGQPEEDIAAHPQLVTGIGALARSNLSRTIYQSVAAFLKITSTPGSLTPEPCVNPNLPLPRSSNESESRPTEVVTAD